MITRKSSEHCAAWIIDHDTITTPTAKIAPVKIHNPFDTQSAIIQPLTPLLPSSFM
jgi:hypothetical protein